VARRVVQFSTGNVGRHALAAIIRHPDLELVGVHASGPVNAIEAVCAARPGLLGQRDLPAVTIRGLLA
jgi:hypothetical protein